MTNLRTHGNIRKLLSRAFRVTSRMLVGWMFGFVCLPAIWGAQPLKRWAVLSSPEVQSTGIADLVAAALTQNAEIEVLDREDYAKILDEAELSQLFSTNDTSTRLRFGQRLTADGLLILSPARLSEVLPEESKKKQESEAAFAEPQAPKIQMKNGVSAVYCDTSTGARIRHERFSLESSDLEQSADSIASQVAEIRRQFPDGVQQLIAVSPFQSNDLIHDFDYLQTAIPRILESHFQQRNNLAVIEFEEAQQIASEISSSAAGSVQRVLPILLAGEYRVANDKERIKLRIKHQNGRGETGEIADENLALQELPEWLQQAANEVIDSGSDLGQSRSVEEQSVWFSSRAKALSSTGNWRLAADVYRAALLIDPQNLKLRDDLLYLCSVLLGDKNNVMTAQQRIEIYREALRHTEFLFRHNMFDQKVAIGELNRLRLPRHDDRLRGHPSLAIAERERQQLFQSILDQELLETPHAAKQTISQRRSWFSTSHLLSSFLMRVDREPPTIDDLKIAYRIWTERTDENRHLVDLQRFESLCQGRGESRTTGRTRVWNLFVNQLAMSDHRGARISARLYRLAARCAEIEQLQLTISQEEFNYLKAAARSLAFEIEEFNSGLQSNQKTPQLKKISWLLYRLSHSLKQTARRPLERSKTIPTAPAKKRTETTQATSMLQRTSSRGGAVKSGAVTLTPLNYDILSSGRYGFRLIQCGDVMDAFWGNGFLGLMREPGKLEVIQHTVTERLRLSQVVWHDGHLWVNTLGKGIWAYDKFGEPKKHIDESHGLPPADGGLKIVFHLGRMFASGSFGEDNRAWIAEIEGYRGDQPRVTVFHEATKQRNADRGGIRVSGETGFIPFLFMPGPEQPPFVNRIGKPSVILVVRYPNYLNMHRSFLINPNNRELKFKAWHDATPNDTPNHYACFENEIFRLIRPSSFNVSSGGSNAYHLFRQGKPRDTQGFVKVRNELYLPGSSSWMRINLYDEEVEVLTKEPIPAFSQLQFASSANYGVAAWLPGPRAPMFQLSIDSSRATELADRQQDNAAVKSRASKTPASISGEHPEAIEADEIRRILALASEYATKTNPVVTSTAYGWMATTWVDTPLVNRELWLDPPDKPVGSKLHFADRKLVRIEKFQSNDFHIPPRTTSTFIHYNDGGLPIFVKRARSCTVLEYDGEGRVYQVAFVDTHRSHVRTVRRYLRNASGEVEVVEYRDRVIGDKDQRSLCQSVKPLAARYEKELRITEQNLSSYGFDPVLPISAIPTQSPE